MKYYLPNDKATGNIGFAKIRAWRIFIDLFVITFDFIFSISIGSRLVNTTFRCSIGQPPKPSIKGLNLLIEDANLREQRVGGVQDNVVGEGHQHRR